MFAKRLQSVDGSAEFVLDKYATMCSADVCTSCLTVKELPTRWLFFGIAPIQTAKKIRLVSSIVREK